MLGIKPAHYWCHKNGALKQWMHVMHTFKIVSYIPLDHDMLSCLVKSDNHHQYASRPTGVNKAAFINVLHTFMQKIVTQ